MRLIPLEETSSKMESINSDDYVENDIYWFTVKQIKPSKTNWTDFIKDNYPMIAKM